MSRTTKALYVPLSVAASVAGGLLAGAVFNQLWRRIDDSAQQPPDPKDLDRPAAAALSAAALQGLIFGLVRAAVDRAGARAYRAITDEAAT
ncbi:MAG: hypothetical protein QOE30_5635 [Mycobacterium sp.]|jgi:hypothetical protein|uniref:DUF4235 domain-containing protein n=1 Tax=Mycobacterium sp. TaxID=1785 RepID=UPI0028B31D59|nr:DUF4235 domain-containing protein [Mycobacterium sp.]MCW2563981.1 putative integral rane protein [Mycobacterium sp.]MDT5119896.1 hypothetical protein [Mycobacterium sp.]